MKRIARLSTVGACRECGTLYRARPDKDKVRAIPSDFSDDRLPVLRETGHKPQVQAGSYWRLVSN